MKKQFLFLISILLGLGIQAQVARVQVVHNSADALTSTVDVYLNGMLTLPDVNFRTSSPFTDLPAGVPLVLAVAPGDSMSALDAFFTETYTLEEGETYIMIAEGIVSPTGYDPAPPFDLYVYDMGREVANNPLEVDLLVHHGSTDAPTVDVYETEVGLGQVVDDISYSEYDGYLELPEDNYTFQIRTADGSQGIAAYIAALESLGVQGVAVTVIASGFFEPSMNSNGPAFGLYAISPAGGAMIPLPPAPLSVGDSEALQFSLYPNPATDVIRLDGLNLSNYQVQITDIQGKQLLENRYSGQNSEISVRGLTAGVYILNIYKDNQRVASKKFVKR
ncbi:DUF4397 domain-containing protein [Aureitalea sp. L0-47]|uniref:T9SS type A sorting domain-containing protein n=1 Tax=Aureitalea sp. L0-47 TaxID=2816962 RepID=UPI002237F79A|nr:DUF4397 domain-containing protein [Aureitalea sp. L0-47]MCW5520640.1 DUF4397 domain-containing protein [Aureitalea sp. L0-47]